MSSKEELQLLRELDRELKRDEFKVTIGEIVKVKIGGGGAECHEINIKAKEICRRIHHIRKRH
ncbi:hypothetical protein LM596_08575 [Liquorilactobacillus mali]|nr:hypothetical protein LMA_09415 [Liquorilactobacillus mali KCTC 3596 = DSM 20444]QFQ75853.1 hypothetical protein LM596_08575 [Liquorilactobacillus mali]